MSVILLRLILFSSVRMAFPLAMVLFLVPIGRKYIHPRTLISIQKLMIAGMFLALAITFLGPLVQVPVSNQLLVPQVSTTPPVQLGQSAILPEITVGGPVLSGNVSTPSLWEIAGVLWLCVAMVLFFLTLIQNARFFHRVYQNSSPAPVDLSEVSLFHSRAIGLRVTPTVRISSEVFSPMAVGYFHPVIFLPVRVLLFAPEEQRLLLSHELYHCKTKDNFWRLFSSILLAVYWFDPLVWVLTRSFSTQCELCCDENVLSGTSVQTRKVYGKLILSFVTRQPDYKQPFLPLKSGWKESFRGFKLRIEQIVYRDQKIPGKVFLIGCISIFLLFSGMIGFRQGNFSPSEVIILSENPMGITWEGTPVPREIHLIHPPIDTDQVFRYTSITEDGISIYDNLYFIANTEHENITAGCDGMIVAIQSKSLDEPENQNILSQILGKYVIIDCGNGFSVRYAYLDSVLVEEGQRVSVGDILGTAGNTGGSYGKPDQCGIYVMQDGLMVDPTLFFDVSTQPAVYPIMY